MTHKVNGHLLNFEDIGDQAWIWVHHVTVTVGELQAPCGPLRDPWGTVGLPTAVRGLSSGKRLRRDVQGGAARGSHCRLPAGADTLILTGKRTWQRADRARWHSSGEEGVAAGPGLSQSCLRARPGLRPLSARGLL